MIWINQNVAFSQWFTHLEHVRKLHYVAWGLMRQQRRELKRWLGQNNYETPFLPIESLQNYFQVISFPALIRTKNILYIWETEEAWQKNYLSWSKIFRWFSMFTPLQYLKKNHYKILHKTDTCATSQLIAILQYKCYLVLPYSDGWPASSRYTDPLDCFE